MAAFVRRSAPVDAGSFRLEEGSPCLAVSLTGGACAGSRCASFVAVDPGLGRSGFAVPGKTRAGRKGNGPAAGRKGRGPAGVCCSCALLSRCHGASSLLHSLRGDGILSRRRFLEWRDTGGEGSLLPPLAAVALCPSLVWDSSMGLFGLPLMTPITIVTTRANRTREREVSGKNWEQVNNCRPTPLIDPRFEPVPSGGIYSWSYLASSAKKPESHNI
jgi:hypothetical protein